MRLRILGPMEVARDGEWGRLRAAKWRSLLAVLAVNVGSPVSIDRLIESLWPADAPATATALIHSYVARVRGALGDQGGRLLRTRSRGYELALATEDLDATHFEDLAVRGCVALRDGDVEGSAVLLAAALELWRGPALDDVPPTDELRPAVERLQELRLSTWEIRIEADLARGRHAELDAELQTLTEANPFRERLWTQRMLALYRSGRRTDALAVHQRLHRNLRDELGIEPAGSVRALHQQILRSDVRLDRTDDEVHAAPVAPGQLPAVARHFVGRDAEIKALDELARSSHDSNAVMICAIAGPPGVGKTAMAVSWGHRVRDRYPDGQLYVDLRGFDPGLPPLPPSDALHGFLTALDVQADRIPDSQDARAALFRSLLADRRMLVVLDNARDADQVRPLLPAGSGCLALVTSRNWLGGLVAEQGAYPITLDPLSDDEAHQLLTSHLGAERVASEPAAVAALIERCGRLPLALTVAAARASTPVELPLTTVAAELADSQRRLDVLDTGEPATAVRAVFSWSYLAAATGTQRLFRLLGLMPGPDVTAAAAASLAGIGLTDARRRLAELVRAHLIAESSGGRYALHDLLRTYAAELVSQHETESERRLALRRLCDSYLHSANVAAQLLIPHRDPISIVPADDAVTPYAPTSNEQATAWFTAELAALQAMLTQTVHLGLDEHCWQLGWALVDFLDRHGLWAELRATQRLALNAARRLGDPHAQAASHRYLARHPDGPEDAEYHIGEAVRISTENGNRTAQARAHKALSTLRAQQGRNEEALTHRCRALELFRADENLPGEADALNGLGWHHAVLGNLDEALALCGQSLALHQRLGRRYGEAATWDSLGYIHHQLGDYQEAITCYQRCHDLYDEIGGDCYYQADTLTHLGEAYLASGDVDAAGQSWQQALTILDRLDHPNAEHVRTRLTEAQATS